MFFDSMSRKSRSVAAVAFALSSLAIVPTARADHLSVCADGCRFTTIQSAIDHARSGDTISIDQGVYAENLAITNTSITLQGAGSNRTILTPATFIPIVGMSCVAKTTRVQLLDVTVTGGRYGDRGAGFGWGWGGGIQNEGCGLTIARVQIVDNISYSGGGGLFSTGPLHMTDSTVVDNIADYVGGMVLLAPAYIARSTIQNNRGTGGHTLRGGGGISSDSDLTIEDSAILENASAYGCCGPGGGLISNGKLRMSGTRVARNVGNAIVTTGDAEITGCTIRDNSGFIDAAGGILNRGSLVIRQSLLMNNSGGMVFGTDAYGGGIQNEGTLVVRHSVLTKNNGWAIVNKGILDLNHVSIVGNVNAGGGVFDAAGATTTIENSTITGNIPSNCGGPGISCP